MKFSLFPGLGVEVACQYSKERGFKLHSEVLLEKCNMYSTLLNNIRKYFIVVMEITAQNLLNRIWKYFHVVVENEFRNISMLQSFY